MANRLLQRLDDIATHLQRIPSAWGLLALGSVGRELDRLDDFSDLDFFVIAQNGCSHEFIDDLSWLHAVHPLAYSFRNTADGHKFFFDDGIYGEWAVFDIGALPHQHFSPGRWVWRRNDDLPEEWSTPRTRSTPWKTDNLEWAIGEITTNLYVGLCRFRRGEKLSGMMFVETHAMKVLIGILHLLYPGTRSNPDDFVNERRLEFHYPDFAQQLPFMLQGYDRVDQSALHILNFLSARVSLNPYVIQTLRNLAVTP